MTLALLSDDPAAQLEATTQFGKLLSGGMNVMLYFIWDVILFS